MTQKVVVITSIFGVTDCVDAFSSLPEWRVVLVGDEKTPEVPRFPSERIEYLSLESQASLGFALQRVLPLNHYSRKNIGYLHAITGGADIIGDTDDDNAPMPGWGSGVVTEGTFEVVTEPEVVNTYRLFTHKYVWPRGFPLRFLRDEGEIKIQERTAEKISLWQGLADGEPDVDAIFRLIFDSEIEFDQRKPIVLGAGIFAPVNSQNTIWFRGAFPYLYLPVTVSMRFTDILRGYVAQRGLHAMGHCVGFTQATVRQKRNPHDPMEDFNSEVSCYQWSYRVIELLRALNLEGNPFSDLSAMYLALGREGIVHESELASVDAWIADLSSMGGV